MKTYVINRQEGTRVPFLRGILTRSLLDAGLPFDTAFKLATSVRKDLADVAEITAEELRERVGARLGVSGDESVLEHYLQPAIGPTRILVRGASGRVSAFSRGRHERYLQSSGIENTVAESITLKIFDQLLTHGTESIDTRALGFLTYSCLREEVGRKAAKRYLVWSEFQRDEKPLMLLIGGAVGTGKSSIATEVAHRLEIVRIQSTDMLREVMRMMIPERLMPILHVSSYEAWKTLPITDNRDRDLLVAEGFRGQSDLLSVSCEAVLQRAERESVPMILEGVHVLPELQSQPSGDTESIRVHVTLAVLSTGELKSRLRGRSAREPKRHAKKYLKNLDSIWRLQSFLLSEADRHDAPIIPNEDREKTVNQVILTVNDELSRQYCGAPEAVYGECAGAAAKSPGMEGWQALVPQLINR